MTRMGETDRTRRGEEGRSMYISVPCYVKRTCQHAGLFPHQMLLIWAKDWCAVATADATAELYR